ncbi:MAG TPA: hypothetical protein PKL83_04185 [bacterium]|nr:hypothetical protein [bacterium]
MTTIHRYIDEAGDTTFFGKGKENIIGQDGVSKSFLLGMVNVKGNAHLLRQLISEQAIAIQNNSYYNSVPSVQNRIKKYGKFIFHAKDDIPEIRKEFYDFIKGIDFTLQAIVGRKIMSLFINKHNSKENIFYADLLSHLLKDKLNNTKLVLNIARRGSSTGKVNLRIALEKARTRASQSPKYSQKPMDCTVAFNEQPYESDPIFSLADYSLWTVQRIVEKGETRFYDYLQEKIRLVVDVYDYQDESKIIKRGKWYNYYDVNNPLTRENKISLSNG